MNTTTQKETFEQRWERVWKNINACANRATVKGAELARLKTIDANDGRNLVTLNCAGEVVDPNHAHKAEFLADFEAKTKLEIHPFTPDPSKVSDPLPCSTCGGPVPPTPQDPASVSARESALMAGWVPVCDKCRRIEEEND